MSSNYTVYTKGDSDVVLQLLKDFFGIELSRSPHEEAVFWGEWVLVPVTFEAQNNMIDDLGIAFSEFPVSIDLVGAPRKVTPICEVLFVKWLPVCLVGICIGLRGNLISLLKMSRRSWSKIPAFEVLTTKKIGFHFQHALTLCSRPSSSFATRISSIIRR